MTSTEQPRQVVDLDALGGVLADSLQDPTYCLTGQVGGGEGFVRFETEDFGSADDESVAVRVRVSLVSDGEDEVSGATDEVFEIVVRRVTA